MYSVPPDLHVVPPELDSSRHGLPVIVRLAVGPVLPLRVTEHHSGHQVCIVFQHLDTESVTDQL